LDRPALLAALAHPDDEAFAIAGTLARYRGAGVRTALFTATDGESGRQSLPVELGRAELARQRRTELLRGAGLLGVGRVFAAGLPDGGLEQHSQDEILALLVRVIRTVRPSVVVTFGPEGAPNDHTDHRTISRLVTAAWFLAANPTYPWADERAAAEAWAPSRLYYTTWSDPSQGARRPMVGVPPTCEVEVTAYLDLKRRAFAEHRSQAHQLGAFERTLTPRESYALAAGVPQPHAATGDLFAGLET
jgi:LmbE family N-acetylglucosaminyl deacetylase